MDIEARIRRLRETAKRDAKIVRLAKSLPMAEIGRQFDISRQRVLQILRREKAK